MGVKAYAEHIEDFTFMPIGGAPDGRDAGYSLTLIDPYLEPDPRFVLERIEMVDDLETWMVSEPIDSGEIRKEIVEKTGILS